MWILAIKQQLLIYSDCHIGSIYINWTSISLWFSSRWKSEGYRFDFCSEFRNMSWAFELDDRPCTGFVVGRCPVLWGFFSRLSGFPLSVKSTPRSKLGTMVRLFRSTFMWLVSHRVVSSRRLLTFHSIVYVHPPPTYSFRTSASFTDRL